MASGILPSPSGRRCLGGWLLGTAGLVVGIISVGGLTRLTNSGLSMVDWKLLHFKPPQSEAEWSEYFDKYKQFPEYQKRNYDMTVEDFKRIYHMEHLHRVYGRILGGLIVFPSIYYLLKRRPAATVKWHLLASSGLVVAQGFIGWHMVKSGLADNSSQDPKVAPTRLATHFAFALAIYGILLDAGLKALLISNAVGALVAGSRAGHIYDTFPKMGSSYIPADYMSFKEAPPSAWLKNALENPAAIQFHHRILALLTATVAVASFAAGRRLGLPRQHGILNGALLGATAGQLLLGIITLLYNVPLEFAAAHQLGSIATVSSFIAALRRIKCVPR